MRAIFKWPASNIVRSGERPNT